jgi:hypothetical protein
VVLRRIFPEPLYKLIVSNPAFVRIDLYCKAELGGVLTPNRVKELRAKYCLAKGIRDFFSAEAATASFEDVANVLCPATLQVPALPVEVERLPASLGGEPTQGNSESRPLQAQRDRSAAARRYQAGWRKLLEYMNDKSEADIDDELCRFVWGEDRDHVTENAIKAALRRANKSRDTTAMKVLSRSGEKITWA